ncbi:MAG: YceI family protein, partial [Candidatus Paceibacterales bacterium]
AFFNCNFIFKSGSMKKSILLFMTIGVINCSFAQMVLTPVDEGSKVHFVIKNFGINVGGDFTGLKGTIRFDPVNFGNSGFDVSVDAGTIDTDNSARDGHLRKTEYFDVVNYKTLNFKSTRVVRSTVVGRFYVYGTLTIKGVSKPVEFGFGATPQNGGYVFDGEFEINRRDFGVGGSSISMSDDLKVSLSVFAKK